MAGASSKCTTAVALPAMPTACQPRPSTRTPGWRSATATSWGCSRPGRHAVSSACVSDAAPEHHAFAPRSRPSGVSVARAVGASAAQVPQRAPAGPGAPPSSAMMASASVWPS